MLNGTINLLRILRISINKIIERVNKDSFSKVHHKHEHNFTKLQMTLLYE